MSIERMQVAVELLDQLVRYHRYGLDPRARTLLLRPGWIEGETLPFRLNSR